MDTLIANVTAVTMNPKMEVIFGAYIGIDNGKIVSISRTAPKEPPQTLVDGTGMVAIPGLINCHTHLASSVLRCLTDDLSNTQKAVEEQKDKKKTILAEYAKGNKTVHQLIDLALLQNGMLKGAALDAFLKRSVSMIK